MLQNEQEESSTLLPEAMTISSNKAAELLGPTTFESLLNETHFEWQFRYSFFLDYGNVFVFALLNERKTSG